MGGALLAFWVPLRHSRMQWGREPRWARRSVAGAASPPSAVLIMRDAKSRTDLAFDKKVT